MSYPQYFNFRGHRYYKSLIGMGSGKGTYDKMCRVCEDNPKIRWGYPQRG